MPASTVPLRATCILRDPDNGLSRDGIFDPKQESQARSIIISARLEQKEKKLKREKKTSLSQLNWNIYAKYVDPIYSEHLRFHNALRKEFLNFIALISNHLLGDTFSSDEVNATVYYILRAVWRIYCKIRKDPHNRIKIKRFTEKIRDDITRYFNKLSNNQWKSLYEIGTKLLYFTTPPDHKSAPKKMEDIDDDEYIQFEGEDVPLFSKESSSETTSDEISINGSSPKANASSNGASPRPTEYILSKKEYGYKLSCTIFYFSINILTFFTLFWNTLESISTIHSL